MKQKKKVKKAPAKTPKVPDNFLRQLGQFKQVANTNNFRATKIHMPRRPK